MKHSLLFTLIFIFATAFLAYADPKAFTPAEHLESADAILNDNYKRIIKLYAGDPAFIEKLKQSQRAWLKFRDAELEALFPHAKTKPSLYGESLHEAMTHWKAVLTEERCMQLARWIAGAESDDPYRGSLRITETK